MVKNPIKVSMGKKSRAVGKRFEIRVRQDLESKGWIIDRWINNVLFEGNGRLAPAKPKYNPFTKQLMMAIGGFPDFIAYSKAGDVDDRRIVIGVESKIAGTLDAIEKEKCKWLLDNQIFSKIFIASKGTKRGEIKYNEFQR